MGTWETLEELRCAWLLPINIATEFAFLPSFNRKVSSVRVMVFVHQKLNESLQGEWVWEIVLMQKERVQDRTGTIQHLAKHSENTIFENILPNKLKNCWEHYTAPPYFISPNYLHLLIQSEHQPELQTSCLYVRREVFLGFLRIEIQDKIKI